MAVSVHFVGSRGGEKTHLQVNEAGERLCQILELKRTVVKMGPETCYFDIVKHNREWHYEAQQWPLDDQGQISGSARQLHRSPIEYSPEAETSYCTSYK